MYLHHRVIVTNFKTGYNGEEKTMLYFYPPHEHLTIVNIVGDNTFIHRVVYKCLLWHFQQLSVGFVCCR